jgi:hypothetical protein
MNSYLYLFLVSWAVWARMLWVMKDQLAVKPYGYPVTIPMWTALVLYIASAFLMSLFHTAYTELS